MRRENLTDLASVAAKSAMLNPQFYEGGVMDTAARLERLEDFEAIRQLKARYCAACDDDHNPAALGPLFAEDATWEAAVTGRAEGRAQIQALLGSVGTSGRIRNSAHHAINPIIDLNGDRATGHWRLIMLYTGRHPSGELHYSRIIGWYKEEYVCLPERDKRRWYIQNLFCHVEEAAPYALAPEASLS